MAAILETADVTHRTGVLDAAALAKITLGHVGQPTRSANLISDEEAQ